MTANAHCLKKVVTRTLSFGNAPIRIVMELLLVEDDIELVRQLSTGLGEHGYRITAESTGQRGLEAACAGGWDLVILDVSLPNISGLEIVAAMRSARIDTPVLFLSAKGEVHERVEGLSLGADDYLVKPFSMDELLARLVALARRKKAVTPLKIPAGWKLDALRREVVSGEERIPLQPREWSLLHLFMEREGEVLTNSFLLDQVWGIRFDPGTNVVNATISRLRKKLDDSSRGSHFETLRGRGHCFRCDV